MNDDENQKLNDIHDEIQGSNSQLGILVERTRKIEQNINDIRDGVQRNEQDINKLESEVRRNTVILNAITVGATAVLIWISDKVLGLAPF